MIKLKKNKIKRINSVVKGFKLIYFNNEKQSGSIFRKKKTSILITNLKKRA